MILELIKKLCTAVVRQHEFRPIKDTSSDIIKSFCNE